MWVLSSPFENGLDPAPRFPRRPRQAANKEHAVFDLKPAQLAGLDVEITLNVT